MSNFLIQQQQESEILDMINKANSNDAFTSKLHFTDKNSKLLIRKIPPQKKQQQKKTEYRFFERIVVPKSCQ